MARDDRAVLAALLVAVVAEGASVGFLPPIDLAAATGYWERVSRSDAVLLVAERGGQIVGTVQFHPAESANGQHRTEIAKLLVDRAYRRLGIGPRLMAAVEAAARQDRRDLLVLDTREGDRSNALYRSLGFQEAGRIPGWSRFADGRREATVFIFEQLAEAETAPWCWNQSPLEPLAGRDQ